MRSERVRSWLTEAGVALAAALVVLALMECASRLFHGGARPMLPSIRDDRGLSRLPADIDFSVSLKNGARWRLTTDAGGARVAQAGSAQASAAGGILVVGDSQALGWDMSLEQAFGARVAARLGVAAAGVRLLAAAAQDPEAQLGWLRDDARAHGQRLRLAIVAVNLGNDFEEMYFGRALRQQTPTPGYIAQLTRHSVLFMDAALVRHHLINRFGSDLPPGVNLSMAALDQDSRQDLVDAAADALARLVATLPPADQVLVVGIPQDTQIDAREFDKYRVYYRDAAEFEKFKSMQRVAAARLDAADAALASGLSKRGIAYLSLLPALKQKYAGAGFIDTGSHHLLAAAHEAAADAVLEALRRPDVSPAPATPVALGGTCCGTGAGERR